MLLPQLDPTRPRSGLGSLLSAGLFFHDTGRYALQRAASGLLQRPKRRTSVRVTDV